MDPSHGRIRGRSPASAARGEAQDVEDERALGAQLEEWAELPSLARIPCRMGEPIEAEPPQGASRARPFLIQ